MSMKVVRTFISADEAKVARTFLHSHGITAELMAEESLSVMPHISMGAKGHQLLVREDQFELGQNLLAEVEASAHTEEPDLEYPLMKRRRVFLTTGVLLTLLLIIWSRMNGA